MIPARPKTNGRIAHRTALVECPARGSRRLPATCRVWLRASGKVRCGSRTSAPRPDRRLRGRVDECRSRRLGHAVLRSLTIEGTVDVEFPKPVHFANGRIIEMGAVVTGGPGRISRSFLAATSNGALGCAGPSTKPARCGWHRSLTIVLALRVSDRSAWAVRGRADVCPIGPEQLISDQRGASQFCCAQPTDAAACLIGETLVRAMAGAEGPTVPATPQAAMMLGRLPPPFRLGRGSPATAARPQPAVVTAWPNRAARRASTAAHDSHELCQSRLFRRRRGCSTTLARVEPWPSPTTANCERTNTKSASAIPSVKP